MADDVLMPIFDVNAAATTFTVTFTCMGGLRERVSSSAGYIYRDSFEFVIAEGPKKVRCLFYRSMKKRERADRFHPDFIALWQVPVPVGVGAAVVAAPVAQAVAEPEADEDDDEDDIDDALLEEYIRL